MSPPSLVASPADDSDGVRRGGSAIAHIDGGSRDVARYEGLLAALCWAAGPGVTALRIRSDSELLVKQMRGEYRVKHPGLQPLHAEARTLVRRIGRVTVEHVRREQNTDADRLANHAMDAAAAALSARGDIHRT